MVIIFLCSRRWSVLIGRSGDGGSVEAVFPVHSDYPRAAAIESLAAATVASGVMPNSR
jgi:hypothetical protein